MWIGLIQKSNMKNSVFSQPRHGITGFALISVLALVSLAAMTATAFLASARLERLATRPLSQTTQLEWALASGEKCAEAVIGDASEPNTGTAKNFVTTLWRGPNPTDYTNETGYLLIGEPNATNSVSWTYWAGFSTAAVTNFSTNVIGSAISFTNSHHGTYSNDCSVFMRAATNGFIANPPSTNKLCTTIELLGGQTSPPVGWVYLTQRKRPAGSLADVETPVARVAWFAEDLSGKIDAERMGGLSGSRLTGTNPEEICLTSLIRTNGTAILPNTSLLTNANNRKLYFTPGLLANSSISGLTNTNDLRYFASGLREFRPTNTLGGTNGFLDWIPCGIPAETNGTSRNPYKMSGYTKANLNNFLALPSSSALTNIANFIRTNIPNFTNRAGGMNGTNYALALAANIIDYADTDASPTASGSTVGYDNYPLPVVFSDKIAWNMNADNPSNSTITVTTYLQLWNCSTLTSPAVTYTLKNNFQDTYLKSNGVTSNIRLFSATLNNTLSVPALGPNQIIILATTNQTNVGTNAGFPIPNLMLKGGGKSNCLGINNNDGNTYADYTNLFELLLPNGTIISKHNGTYQRIGQKITNLSWDFEGTCLTMSRSNSNKIAPIGDPRMLRFLSNPAANPLQYRSSSTSSKNLKWGGYANFTSHPTNINVWNGHPDNWPDGRYGTNAPLTGTGQTGGAGGSIPVAVGTPITLPGTAPAILTTNGKFLTITELGNIFDPIQWKPPNTFTNNPTYYNCNIDSTWTNTGAELHGGGTTLRIGRAEHSRFAFTIFAGTGNPIPNMGQSAAALLDLFCVTNGNDKGGPFRTGGKININTAPYPVLAALAGGITPLKDPNQVGSAINTTMINAFTTGVMKFRHLYPFLTPSQLLFISVNYGDTGWTNPAVWSQAAVFSRNQGLMGVTSINDEGLEEWFSKIYQLSEVSSQNYRVYIVAQLVDTNRMPTSPKARKYVHFASRPNTTANGPTNTSFGVNMYYWTLTRGFKKTYESPY